MRFVAAFLAALFVAAPALAKPNDPLQSAGKSPDIDTACRNATDPTRNTKQFDEAVLVSILGQNPTHPMDVVRLTLDSRDIDHNERIVPDNMERTLTLQPPIPLDRFHVMTVMFDEPLTQLVPPPEGLTEQATKAWWDEGHITKLSLVQSLYQDRSDAPQYWRIHVPHKSSAFGPLWPIQRQIFAVIACPKQNVNPRAVVKEEGPERPMAYLVSRDVSDNTWAIVDTILAIVIIWIGAAAALKQPSRDRPATAQRGGPHDRLSHLLRAMDPIVITQDALGFGSLSRLQVFYFTLIVVATLTYVFLRSGFLSEISDSILWLLGITGVSTAAVKLVSNGRVAREDEITFTTDRWLHRHGIVFPRRVPRWRDLLITGQEFNIFNFQSLIFSVLVGFWILSSAMQNLADLTIPPHLMILLGLSQALYVGGKALGSGADPRRKLNNAVTHAVASETKLLDSLPIGERFRQEAQERGFRYGLGEQPPTPCAVVPPQARDVFLMFQRDASAVVSLANAVLGGRERIQVMPVDPPDDTFSAPVADAAAATVAEPAPEPATRLTVTSEAALSQATQAGKGAEPAPVA